MDKYSIGSTSDPLYAGMAEISPNKTLLAINLTDNPVGKPEIIKGLKNLEDVFAQFKPSVNVEFRDDDAGLVLETFRFSSLNDFSIKGLTSQSELLKELTFKKETFERITMQVKTNRLLNYALADKNTKEALLNCLIALRAELEMEDNKP